MRRAGSKVLRHTGLEKLTVEIASLQKIGQRFFHMASYEWRYSPVCIPEYPRPHSEAAPEQSSCVPRPLPQGIKDRAPLERKRTFPLH
jgi:hypothetical protein